MTLRLGRHTFDDDRPLVMAIVNRTRDSFFDGGATFDEEPARERVRQVVAEGADIVDIGGVRAGQEGPWVDAAEEKARVVDFVGWVRSEFPGVVISVDTWRAEVAAAVCEAGADLINDAWGGWEPELVDVAAQYDAAIVCSHTTGVAPRTDPVRPVYDDVVAHIRETCLAYADRALAAGVSKGSIVIDPAHDFNKTTAHSLETTRRLGELVGTGWPVLVSLSNKDFVGETLDLPTGERLYGSLAAASVSAWLGARVYRVHQVRETRQTVDMVWSIAGRRPPAVARRGL